MTEVDGIIGRDERDKGGWTGATVFPGLWMMAEEGIRTGVLDR